MFEWMLVCETIREYLRRDLDGRREAAEVELQVHPLVTVLLLVGPGSLALVRWSGASIRTLVYRVARASRTAAAKPVAFARRRVHSSS
jgi:hypothetical protein